MSQIVEVNEDGALYLSPEVLGNAKPHTRYKVKTQGKMLVLVKVADDEPSISDARRLYETRTPEQRAEAFRQWANEERPPAPPLPDEALRRENMYD
jgi:hypothetical protein